MKEKKEPTCQNCKHHSNKPATCNLKKIFMGRKKPVCEHFRRKV